MQMGTKTKTPGLFKTPDGYAIRIKVKSGSLTTERRKTLPGATEREALVELARLRRAVGLEAESSKRGETTTTVSAWARRWCEELGERQARDDLARRTVKTHRRNLDVFILPFIGRQELDDVKPKTIKGWLGEVRAMRMPALRRGRGKKLYAQEAKPYAKATIANAWRTLREFMRWCAVEADMRNPATDVRFRAENAPAAKERVWLTAPEVAALKNAARRDKNPCALALVSVSLEGAMRPSESSGLDRDDFDATRHTVRISKSHTEGRVRQRAKTAASRRVVHLSPETAAEVSAWIARHDAQGGRGRPILFPTAVGTRMTPKAINDILRRCYVAAGLTKNVTSYALRRTTNNQLRRARGELVAQAVTGHVTQQMTDHYSDYDHAERVAALRDAFAVGTTLAVPPGPGGGAPPETPIVVEN